MTDNEIIKALECCFTCTCISNKCPYEEMHDIPKCTSKLSKDALSLINRQQAKIEECKKGLAEVLKGIQEAKALYVRDIARVKTEAVKEFAERLKKNEGRRGVPIGTIDRLVKEMVGDNDAK